MDKKSLIGQKLYKLGQWFDDRPQLYVIREFEITKESPKYLWIAPRDIKNKKAMQVSAKIKKNDNRYRFCKEQLVKAAILEQNATINKSKLAIKIARQEIADLRAL